MGYEPEDLPWEVPLIELGLDSLMAVRIKNRVEYDFDLPPIQLTAVRDANLYAVEKLIEYAIEHRDEVEQLHEHQQTLTPEEIAAEQAAMMAGGGVPTDAPAEPEEVAPAPVSDIPPPPTNPAGPDQPSAASLAAQVLTQEAVTEALALATTITSSKALTGLLQESCTCWLRAVADRLVMSSTNVPQSG